MFMRTLIGMLAFHGVFSTYGFWLPNDPRGSWSRHVASHSLYQAAGKATKVATRRSVAKRAHDHAARQRAKRSLARQPVSFNGYQAQAVGKGFANTIAKSGYRVLACAILPEHIHVVVVAGRYRARQVLGHFKREAALELKTKGLHPFLTSTGDIAHTCWAEGSWPVFLDSEEAVHRAIQYVEQNPMREGKPRQHWSFVSKVSGSNSHGIGTMPANTHRKPAPSRCRESDPAQPQIPAK